jgi:hypothetical protein
VIDFELELVGSILGAQLADGIDDLDLLAGIGNESPFGSVALPTWVGS